MTFARFFLLIDALVWELFRVSVHLLHHVLLRARHWLLMRGYGRGE